MEKSERNTQWKNDMVERCESLSELKELLDTNNDYHQRWKEYINHLVEVNHVNYIQMGRLCHSSKNTVKKWCKEGAIPQNREAFMKIALGFRLDLEETNYMLQRYGKYPKLYAKSMEDAVCMFVIRHYPQSGDAYEYYLQLKEELLKLLRQSELSGKIPDIDTSSVEEGVLSKETLEDFSAFVLENRKVFLSSFDKLIEYIELFIKSKSDNIHDFIKSNELDFSYEKMLSQLKTKRECPSRIKLILLGVHLNMSRDNINGMLGFAHMEPLCAKDNLECVIVYVVTNAYLNNPSYEVESAMVLQYYNRNPEIQKKAILYLKEYTEFPERDDRNSSDMEDGIGAYLQSVLKELEWEDKDIFRFI